MKRVMAIVALAALVTGCGRSGGPVPAIVPVPADPIPQVAPLVVAGQSAAAFDTTTPAERAAALAEVPAVSERDLGLMVVALGSPAEAGLWLSAGAVTAPAKGRVLTADGQSLTLELRPGTGGALLSLAAFRALGLGLTDLPELRVFAN